MGYETITNFKLSYLFTKLLSNLQPYTAIPVIDLSLLLITQYCVSMVYRLELWIA